MHIKNHRCLLIDCSRYRGIVYYCCYYNILVRVWVTTVGFWCCGCGRTGSLENGLYVVAGGCWTDAAAVVVCCCRWPVAATGLSVAADVFSFCNTCFDQRVHWMVRPRGTVGTGFKGLRERVYVYLKFWLNRVRYSRYRIRSEVINYNYFQGPLEESGK